MRIISSVIRSFRRQLHTIVSQEIIKPFSTTPSHLKTHNLSLLDQTVASTFMPTILFYPNTGVSTRSSRDKTLDLKHSLSETLTKYYPLAGRHAKVAPSFVDCNDEGAEFFEASVDTTLSGFLQNSRHEDFNPLFPYGRVWSESTHVFRSDIVIPLMVQVNHFECGGVAVAASLSHKIADARGFVHFLRDWAKVTKDIPIDPPHFLSFPNKKIKFPEFVLQTSKDFVSKSFIFSNSKLSELKDQITAMTGGTIGNPTRVEVLSWLLYKCAVAAVTENNSGCFRPTGLGLAMDIRTKMMEPLPEKTIGNIIIISGVQAKNQSEMKPELVIGEFEKQKMGIRSMKNIQRAFDHLLNIPSTESDSGEPNEIYNDGYICTSVCNSSVYEIDFGWGKPIKATIAGKLTKNSFILMDDSTQNGIEAIVCLEKQDMTIFQSDPHLLTFAN